MKCEKCGHKPILDKIHASFHSAQVRWVLTTVGGKVFLKRYFFGQETNAAEFITLKAAKQAFALEISSAVSRIG